VINAIKRLFSRSPATVPEPEPWVPEKPRLIEFGSPEMEQAFDEGLSWYQPVLEGVELGRENRNARFSLENLRKVAEAIPEPVSRIVVRPRWQTLVVFGADKPYLACGFAVGYGGTGPEALVAFAHEQGFGVSPDDSVELDDHARYRVISDRVVGVAEDFEGVLFSRPVLVDGFGGSDGGPT